MKKHHAKAKRPMWLGPGDAAMSVVGGRYYLEVDGKMAGYLASADLPTLKVDTVENG